jgi:hypothetical protein
MNETFEFAIRAAMTGIGATIVMDLWGLAATRALRFPPLDFTLVGRWLGHMRHGRFRHDSIARAAPVAGERVIGWTAHYVIGVGFAALLLALYGLDWARRPTLLPALIVGLATLAAPFFLMQPGMGAGIAASRTPNPGEARMRSVWNHLFFGAGLYVSARLTGAVL